MKEDILHINHISYNDFYDIKLKERKNSSLNFLELLTKGLELKEYISDHRYANIVLYIASDGKLYIDPYKGTKINGKLFYKIEAIHASGTQIKFFDNQSNEIWKIIKFPSIYSTETFCKYYTKIVEEYLSYSTSSKINFKYLKL
mgnify:CR=1 FL=1|jgi:hypothetical protein